jgi:ATP-dependent Clp protease adapter protein ClpS
MVIARLAGAVLLLFGVAVAVFLCWGLTRLLGFRGTPHGEGLLLIGILFSVSAFCCLVGFRLLFRRPNKHGSLLPPAGWIVLMVAFFACALLLLWSAKDAAGWVGALLPAALGGVCVLAARGASRKAMLVSTISARQPDLLKPEEFARKGFRGSIEIVNDSTTPMEFVVSMLQEHALMDKTDAVRTMLRIHTNGSVLLPSASMEDAAKAVDAITAASIAAGHSLVCRAVEPKL